MLLRLVGANEAEVCTSSTIPLPTNRGNIRIGVL